MSRVIFNSHRSIAHPRDAHIDGKECVVIKRMKAITFEDNILFMVRFPNISNTRYFVFATELELERPTSIHEVSRLP